MAAPELDDLAWQQALDWLMREHENGLDDTARKGLAAWLKAEPRNQRAYEQARRLWLLTGLVPSMEDTGDTSLPLREDDQP